MTKNKNQEKKKKKKKNEQKKNKIKKNNNKKTGIHIYKIQKSQWAFNVEPTLIDLDSMFFNIVCLMGYLHGSQQIINNHGVL